MTTSLTDHLNNDITFRRLNHFQHHSMKSRLGVWRLLVIDDFRSHMSYEFYHYAQAYKIKSFQLSFHSKHLTWHLDVGCFQSFKHNPKEKFDKIV